MYRANTTEKRPSDRRPFVAYVYDPVAVAGAGPLMRQKKAIERTAADLGGRIDRWVVDSGRRFSGQRCGDAALRMLRELGRGDTVIVADLALLGNDEEAVAVIAGTLEMLGIAVIAAHGAFARVPAIEGGNHHRRHSPVRLAAAPIETDL